jgi:serine/threonine protein kinase
MEQPRSEELDIFEGAATKGAEEMTPERYQQVTALFHAARENRAALDGADPELRREVESLLEHDGASLPSYIADLTQLLPKRYRPSNQPAVRRETVTGSTTTPPLETIDGRYKLLRQLGSGGMGKVFRAIDVETGQPVAIKIIRSAQALSEGARMRFVREARAVAGLHHPGIVAVHDIGQIKGNLYMVMEYVRGSRLDFAAERAPISLRSKLSIMAQVCDALGYAHAQGIVHRDVKPENILVLRDQSVKVVDFGIAEQADLPNSLVQGGGTILYMSPEQIEGQTVDARSDIWSTGITLFVFLTGKLPYGSKQEIISAPPPVLPQDFPLASEINALLARALAKDREARYARAEEFGTDLRQLLENYERPDGPANPARNAESFASDKKYVLPDLNFSFPIKGELTVKERTLGRQGTRNNVLGDRDHEVLLQSIWKMAVYGLLAWLLALSTRSITAVAVLGALAGLALLGFYGWRIVSYLVGWTLEIPARLPRCQGCRLWMRRTAHWVRVVESKEEAIFGYRDCMAALRYGLWQDAAKLLSIHGAKYAVENGSRFVTPARYHLHFFECELCGDHAARLTSDEKVNGKWEQQPKFGEVYWGTSTQRPSQPWRTAAAPRAYFRVLAEHLRCSFPVWHRRGGGMMFFRKKEDLQQLNLEAPKPAPFSPPPVTPATQSIPLPNIDPARLEAVNQRAKEILESGRIPEWLFVCSVNDGLLMFRPARDQKPVMLLFSSPFAATDYLRATSTPGAVRQLKVETLPESVQSWLSLGLQAAVLDRCPRCPQFLSMDLAGMAKWTKEDFAKIWAQLRATRSVLGEIRIRSAMNHLRAGSLASLATARSDLEYVRDHFDCGVPYLHQMIGLLAGIQQDEPAKASAIERLKEFGPQFEGPLDFSPDLLAIAKVGLMMNFGIIPPGSDSK